MTNQPGCMASHKPHLSMQRSNEMRKNGFHFACSLFFLNLPLFLLIFASKSVKCYWSHPSLDGVKSVGRQLAISACWALKLMIERMIILLSREPSLNLEGACWSRSNPQDQGYINKLFRGIFAIHFAFGTKEMTPILMVMNVRFRALARIRVARF